MAMVLRRANIVLACLLGVSLGCSDAPSGPATVYGKVQYHDINIAGARLAFIPDENKGTHGAIIRAETGLDGNYVLHSDDPAGIPPGCYRITVMALESSAAPTDSQPAGAGKSILPDKYSDPELSELSCEIEAGQTNEVNLVLH